MSKVLDFVLQVRKSYNDKSELYTFHWGSVKEFSCQKAINFALETGLEFSPL